MAVTRTDANALIAENADLGTGIELATVAFTDPDNPVPVGQDNDVTIAVSGGTNLQASDFEYRADGKIYLKSDADLTVAADTAVTVTVTPRTTGHGDEPNAEIFTFTITNVAPAPTEHDGVTDSARDVLQGDDGSGAAVVDHFKVDNDYSSDLALADIIRNFSRADGDKIDLPDADFPSGTKVYYQASDALTDDPTNEVVPTRTVPRLKSLRSSTTRITCRDWRLPRRGYRGSGNSGAAPAGSGGCGTTSPRYSTLTMRLMAATPPECLCGVRLPGINSLLIVPPETGVTPMSS